MTMPQVAGHPNRTEFHGVLTTADVPSQKVTLARKGSSGGVNREGVAEAALPSLLGMAVDYSPSLDRHDVHRKVGVITRAEIVGRNLEVGGYLFARDFPEIVEEIASASNPQPPVICRSLQQTIGGPIGCMGSRMAMNASRSEGLKHSLRAVSEQFRGLSELLGNKKRQEIIHANQGMRAQARGANAPGRDWGCHTRSAWWTSA